MTSRIPDEWRVPIAFAVLWIAPVLVADGLLLRTHGRAAWVAAAFSVLVVVASTNTLLRRSRAAWYLLMVIYTAAIFDWIYRLAAHGFGVARTLWGVLTLVNFVLLYSAPMRRFVRLRGWLAAGPR